ncbi:hypothetical protein BC629DRAFT_171432 [Irpex lacteus]|nr:hypothetical protein BC629DRAFT_171432 [Irpex lacteus]
MSCAQIQVTGGGSAKPATVSFPGAYTAHYRVHYPYRCRTPPRGFHHQLSSHHASLSFISTVGLNEHSKDEGRLAFIGSVSFRNHDLEHSRSWGVLMKTNRLLWAQKFLHPSLPANFSSLLCLSFRFHQHQSPHTWTSTASHLVAVQSPCPCPLVVAPHHSLLIIFNGPSIIKPEIAYITNYLAVVGQRNAYELQRLASEGY